MNQHTMRELGKVFQLSLIPSRSSTSLHWSFSASKSMVGVGDRSLGPVLIQGEGRGVNGANEAAKNFDFWATPGH